jgi:hypothetical protein
VVASQEQPGCHEQAAASSSASPQQQQQQQQRHPADKPLVGGSFLAAAVPLMGGNGGSGSGGGGGDGGSWGGSWGGAEGPGAATPLFLLAAADDAKQQRQDGSKQRPDNPALDMLTESSELDEMAEEAGGYGGKRRGNQRCVEVVIEGWPEVGSLPSQVRAALAAGASSSRAPPHGPLGCSRPPSVPPAGAAWPCSPRPGHRCCAALAPPQAAAALGGCRPWRCARRCRAAADAALWPSPPPPPPTPRRRS